MTKIPTQFWRKLGDAIAYGALGILIATIVVLVGVPAAFIGSHFYTSWFRGYGIACQSKAIADVAAPSRRWIARTRYLYCDDLWLEVVLIPNDFVPLFSRHRRIFIRTVDNDHSATNEISVTWSDDHRLELRAAGCEHRECNVTASMDGITISLNSADEPAP